MPKDPASMTIREVLDLARLFDAALVREIMNVPLDRIADRLREAARVSSRSRTAVVDRRGVVVTLGE